MEMEINRTKLLFQSHEHIKLTTIFQPSSKLKLRPYFSVDSKSKWRPLFNVEASTLYQRWNMVARRRGQYSTILPTGIVFNICFCSSNSFQIHQNAWFRHIVFIFSLNKVTTRFKYRQNASFRELASFQTFL